MIFFIIFMISSVFFIFNISFWFINVNCFSNLFIYWLVIVFSCKILLFSYIFVFIVLEMVFYISCSYLNSIICILFIVGIFINMIFILVFGFSICSLIIISYNSLISMFYFGFSCFLSNSCNLFIWIKKWFSLYYNWICFIWFIVSNFILFGNLSLSFFMFYSLNLFGICSNGGFLFVWLFD